MNNLPFHLKKYIIEQEPSKYTPIDQAVWRFTLRQLKTFLSKNAHESYVEGLKMTGISVEEIPSIDQISKHLEKFGWRAVPVSGFIPPAAFMEMQARKLLPIAADMRTLDHLTYTPAPDIVHEAAGHAPMVANPEFRKYLENYAEVANKAIINHKDLDLYAAIRDLSDIKEHPNSTQEEITKAQTHLDSIAKNMGAPSEASKLSRMAWWTTEYGLVDHNEPKIFGAGLLSSAGESRFAMTNKAKKIPLSLDCVEFSYDITEMQPQLFVAHNFESLNKVLFEFAETMAYKKGHMYGLTVHQESQTINTVELNSGLQVGGKLKNILTENNEPVYLRFEGPCQLAYKSKELPNQGRVRHPQGFGCPIGKLKDKKECLSVTGDSGLAKIGMIEAQDVNLEWSSGVKLTGKLSSIVHKDCRNLLFTFKDCKVTLKDQILFDPSWGEYDLAVGSYVPSVYAGAPDRETFGEVDDFVAKKIPQKKYTEKEKTLFHLYQKVRDIRKTLKNNSESEVELNSILEILKKEYPNEWLLKLEILEISYQMKNKLKAHDQLVEELKIHSSMAKEKEVFILEGLKIASQLEA